METLDLFLFKKLLIQVSLYTFKDARKGYPAFYKPLNVRQ